MTKYTPTIRRHGTSAAYEIKVGPHTWYYSRGSLIAYRGPNAPAGVRRDELRSAAMFRHLSGMGCNDWQRLPDVEFDCVANVSVTR